MSKEKKEILLFFFECWEKKESVKRNVKSSRLLKVHFKKERIVGRKGKEQRRNVLVTFFNKTGYC